MTFVSTQCASQSLGPANQLFAVLVQTILAAQCNISAPEQWPKDQGPNAFENGEIFIIIMASVSASLTTINKTIKTKTKSKKKKKKHSKAF